jgi:Uma2 family endonuclease
MRNVRKINVMGAAMSIAPDRYISLDDYFLLEETGEIKHEYYQGAAYAMTSGSIAHNIIVANTISQIHAQLHAKSCTVFAINLRLKVEATGLYTYPDLTVICGPVRSADGRNDTITNPSVLIEVLSPSTEGYDRGRKFQHYRTIGTLRDYLLIAQDGMHIEQYSRQEEYQWLLQEYSPIDNIVHLASIDCSLALTAIYEEVRFTEGE